MQAETPVGEMVIGACEGGGGGVCLCEFSDRPALASELDELAEHFGAPVSEGSSEHAERLAAELRLYFKGELEVFKTPLVMPGTEFEQAVWSRLREIPYGETMSYGEVARALGKPGASRAVGRANGRNRIAIVVPCHRVIESTGALRGYGGGLWRKKRLLELERAHGAGSLWSGSAAAAG